uniref:Fibronectin type-III domain-containing protein n=1 Tax=Oncorhynchus mykiss TaxID=8022 RepID=A0A8C7UXP0_ONCMY
MNNFARPIFQFLISLCSLPAPVNVSIESLNFHHVLRWSAGPGTPPGTVYKIIRRRNHRPQVPHQTNVTSHRLDLKFPKEEYTFCVSAFHNLSESPVVETTFTPFTQTVIGSPILSLDGCGNCLEINITLLEIETIKKVYGTSLSFDIYWKRAGETKPQMTQTTHLAYMLENLEVGMVYCVRVYTRIITNLNTRSSGWKCAYTSILEPNRVPAVVAGVSVVLIVSGVGLMVLTFGLFYTGFLCKLKTHQPRGLTALVEGHFLIPEQTIPDLVSISSATEEQGKARRSKTHHDRENSNQAGEEEEDEDEDEEGGNDGYMDRAAGLSSDSSSSTTQSQDASGANVAILDTAGHSVGLSSAAAAEEEREAPVGVMVLGCQAQGEVTGEQARVISSFDGDRPRPLGLGWLGGEEEEEEKEREVEEKETSGNVNLFSVTLGALKREEEGECEEETDFLLEFSKQEQKPQLPIDSLQRNLRPGSMRSQSEIQEDTGLVLTLPKTVCTWIYSEYSNRHADSSTETHSGYLVTHTGTVQADNETEEEEEEEDFSGYMGH